MKQSLVTVANEQVPIATVLRMFGVEVDPTARSPKLHCPFEQLNHSDQGVEAAMRVYADSNSAYCFACTVYFTPVGLAAQAWDVHWRAAAARLLEHIGYRPLNLAAMWEQAVQFEQAPNRTQLAQALKTFCRRIDSQWDARQFDADVARQLSRCFDLLDLVCSPQDAQLWLDRCKTAMQQALDTPKPS